MAAGSRPISSSTPARATTATSCHSIRWHLEASSRKTLYPKSLLAFGWGDGAGGPTKKMLENYARIKEFPALPRLADGTIEEFFRRHAGRRIAALGRRTLPGAASRHADDPGADQTAQPQSEHRLLEAEAFRRRKFAGHAYAWRGHRGRLEKAAAQPIP